MLAAIGDNTFYDSRSFGRCHSLYNDDNRVPRLSRMQRGGFHEADVMMMMIDEFPCVGDVGACTTSKDLCVCVCVCVIKG